MPPRERTATSVRAAANVDNHRAGGLFDREADADSGSDRLRNGDDVVGSGAVSRIHDGAAFDGGNTVRHGHDDGEIGEEGLTGNLADKVAEHVLANLEVGDDAVLHRTQGLDVARGTPEHHARFIADGDRLARTGPDGDDARLAKDDAAILEEDKRVGRAKVDANGLGE